jgi:hypothetical protein
VHILSSLEGYRAEEGAIISNAACGGSSELSNNGFIIKN